MLFAVLAHKLLVIKEVLTTQKVIPHVEVTLLQFVIPYHYHICGQYNPHSDILV